MPGLTAAFKKVEANRDLCFDLLRIYLGTGLFVKGILFLTDMTALSDLLMQSGRFQPFTFLLSHYIPVAHIGGGFMMAIGLWTRTAILVNIPVLFGAVFFVYFEKGLFTQNQGLEFTALVFFLLIVLLIWGPGRWSVDSYLEKAGPPE
jgi:uncharacterized membrane protein YphA (DoxX/SURF4 family)